MKDPLQHLMSRDVRIRRRVPLSRYTMMGTGGPADWFLDISSCRSLKEVVIFLHQKGIPSIFLGNGSNMIFPDEGFDGVVMRLRGVFENIWFSGKTAIAGGGSQLPQLARKSVRESLGGLERLAGIPATVGGGTMMNAGSYGQEIGEFLQSIVLMYPGGDTRKVYAQDIRFEYRRTSLRPDSIILFVVFRLAQEDPKQLEQSLKESINARRASLPTGRHCGSVFKNPPGEQAWKLVEGCGLRGTTIGGAEISTKHANVIVNKNHATSSDVFRLTRLMASEVKKRYGIVLDPEVRFIGFPSLVES